MNQDTNNTIDQVCIKSRDLTLFETLLFPVIFVFMPILTGLAIQDYAIKESAIIKRDNLACYRVVEGYNDVEEIYDPKKNYCQILDDIFRKQRLGTVHKFSFVNK